MQIFPQGKLPEVFYSLVFPKYLFLAQQKKPNSWYIYCIFIYQRWSPFNWFSCTPVPSSGHLAQRTLFSSGQFNFLEV